MERTVDIAARVGARLGEGSFWDWRKGVLYWVDLEAGRLYTYDPRTGRNERYDAGEKIGTVVPTQGGRLLLALTHSLAELDTEKGSLRKLADLEPEVPGNRSNDGKCDSRGRLWIGTMAPDDKPGGASLYRFDPDHSLRKMLGGVTISNGVAWSADGSKMYYIDTPTNHVSVFDYSLESGEIRDRRECIAIPASLGSPDGMTIDEEGMLWVALFGGHGVARCDPARGTIVDIVELPAKNITSCAFGGSNLDELYVTSARILLSEQELAEQPDAGSLFRVKTGARGVPSPFFAG